MSRFSRVSFSLIIAILFIGFPSTHAGWLLDDIPVCTDVMQQQKPVIAPDGEGGSFVAWEDARSNSDVFIQKHDTDGNALWAVNGINLGETDEGAKDPAILPDGTGGAFVVFLVDSSFCFYGSQYCDIFTMGWCNRMNLARIAPDGSILWKKHIAPISPAGHTDLVTEKNDWMFLDGEGGIVIIWQMSRGYTPPSYCDPPAGPCSGMWAPYYLYAQRIDAQGNRLWGAMPVRVCSNASSQGSYGAARDESGSIVVAWTDTRSEGIQYGDIYAQKIDANGNVLWAPAGVPVIVYTAKQIAPCVVPDGSGSVFIAWKDHRSALNPSNIHIYAQRLDRFGNATWAPEGALVTEDFGPKNVLGITASTLGSCIVFWANGDDSYGSSLFAHRIDTTGSELWQAGGLALSEGSSKAVSARAIPTQDGGAVFAWEQEGNCYNGCAFRAIWGSSANDIFAVGDRGIIHHYNGTSWSNMENPAKYYDLWGVWGTASDNVYAVGYAYIVHYDGYAWHSENNPAGYNSHLRGIWGSGPDDIYAVGPGILHFDGTSWSKVDSTGWSLYGVYGTSSTNIYATGDDFIVHYDGSSWTKTELPYTRLRCIWVSPGNHIFISTYEGIIHNNGSGWAKLPLDAHHAYGQGIWGDSSSNVYAVFDLGYLLHYDGTTATTTQIAPSLKFVYGIWGTAGSDVWACGHPRSVRHFDGSEWVSVYETSGTLYMNKVDSAGNPLWNEDGAPLTNGYAEQTNVALTSDGQGNALLAWRDSRNINWDIYTRKVSIARGPIVATELMSFDTSLLGTGIMVSWRLSRCDKEAEFSVSRAASWDQEAWIEISPAISRNDLTFSFVDSTVEALAKYRYRVRVSDDEGSRILFETDAIAVPAPPIALDQNFPNPFNPSTTIQYCLPERCRVSLRIYNVSGRLIADLIDRDQALGRHSITWNGEDTHGRRTASGIYFCRLRVGKQVLSRKMVLLH